MKFNINKNLLIRPLQLVSNVVERRHSMAILGNLQLVLSDGLLKITGSDTELEMVVSCPVEQVTGGEITVPARKFVDICRNLPEEAPLGFSLEGSHAMVRSGKSRFKLSTLPASEFPEMEIKGQQRQLAMDTAVLGHLIHGTQFAMAQQDVRYYLNGMLIEIGGGMVRAVATDGHRLATCESAGSVTGLPEDVEQLILPRKSVLEVAKVLAEGVESVSLGIGPQFIRVQTGNVQLTSKLVDGKYPDYQKVIPDSERCDKNVLVDRERMRQGLVRASILANEKYRAVRLTLEAGVLRVMAHNPEQEEAEEELPVEYDGEVLEIGFNVNYMIDAIGAVQTNNVRLSLSDNNSSCLIRGQDDEGCRYVVMPMRL